jgi:hypothetical protein
MKFIRILRTLSESERKEFDNYLKAPIGRKPRVSNKIIEAFTANENFESFMNENFNKRSRWNTYSELTITLEDFLAAKRLLNINKNRNEHLAEEFSSRGLKDLSILFYEQELKSLTNSNPDEEILLRSLQLQWKYNKLLYGTSEITKLRSNLNSRYEIQTIRFAFESLMLQLEFETVKKNFKNLSVELFIALTNSIDFKKIIRLTKTKAPYFYPLLNMVHKTLSLYSQPFSFSRFESVRKYFYENMESFTTDFKARMYFMLINYLILMRNSGHESTDKFLFELLRKKISEGITGDLQHENLDRNHFRDYVVIALRVNELNWASEFIEKYSSLLPPGQRENEENVVKAMISLKSRNFVSAIRYIEKVKRSDYLYAMDYFRILIISKFELNEYMECLKQTNKFKRYLWTATDIPEVYSNRYKRFLKITTNLIDYKQTGEGGYLDAIDIEIEEDKNVPGFNWIMEKTKELIKLKERRVSK